MPAGAGPWDLLSDAVRRTAAETAGRERTGRSHDDADSTLGTVATDDAIGFDPRPLLRAFDAAGARVVVMGQVAGILYGSRELTGDLDLLWSGDGAEAPALAGALAAQGAELTDDDGSPVPCTAASLALPKVQFRSPQASGDCCTPALPWGALDVAAFLGRARTASDADGVQLHYLALEDLVAMRRAVGRPKDLRRAAELEHLGNRSPN